jgi:hypothetical protein
MFTRDCPDCNKQIQYKWNCELRVANERNSVCKSCRTSRANKSLKRNNKWANNPAWKGYKEIPGNWFTKYFLRSNRKRTGDITIQDVWDLYEKQNRKCALSGISISFNKTESGISASLDRIDSSKEYTKDNIQLVHKDVNTMKNKFNQTDFIKFCILIADKARNG